jgi:signal transduction histidine kinase
LEAKVRERTAALEAANERLKEMDRLKSQFLAHVSHELRTPLTSIKGFVENLLERLSGPLTDKQEKDLTRVKDNTNRLARMIAICWIVPESTPVSLSSPSVRWR